MDCTVSARKLRLTCEIDAASYLDVIVHGTKLTRKNRKTGEEIVYFQGRTYLPEDWIGCQAVCILLEPQDCEDLMSMPSGKLSHAKEEETEHYGIIIQRTKANIKTIGGKEYRAALVQVPQGWVDRRMGIYKLKD